MSSDNIKMRLWERDMLQMWDIFEGRDPTYKTKDPNSAAAVALTAVKAHIADAGSATPGLAAHSGRRQKVGVGDASPPATAALIPSDPPLQ